MNAMQPPQSIEEIKAGLETTEKGGVRQSIRNCLTVFQRDPLLSGAIAYNILTDRKDIIKPIGFHRESTALTDTDMKYLLLYLEETYGLTNEKKIDNAIGIVANENKYHPIRDYLSALVWDGTERIRFCLRHFLGADADDYTYEALKLFLLGAISRAFQPGCKFEIMLCLVGGQGAGKSTFFRLLAVRDEWFSDDLRKLDDDNVYRKLQGHWMIEMSEMMATANAKSIEEIKSFLSRQKEVYKIPYVHILNWALHLDESTPHIHERHVFDCENQYGEIAPQQEKALEALGFELPEPEKPVGRKNNRKMTFDSACRVLLFDVAKKHGLQLEEEPEYGGCAYLEKQDYILFKQKEQLAAQEQKLEELTMKIEDVEALVDEVADIAYDKAVEVVADTVKLETHKEDIKLVEQSKAWVLSPERKASKKEVEYAVKRLDGVIARITNAMKSTIQKIQTTLMKPEVKKAGTEQIKKKAKNSIIEQLSRKKKEIAEREVSRTDQAKSKKQDMEL